MSFLNSLIAYSEKTLLNHTMNTIATPAAFILCQKDGLIKNVPKEEACPNGWNILGYVILRQGLKYLADQKETNYKSAFNANLILEELNKKKPKKILIIDTHGPIENKYRMDATEENYKRHYFPHASYIETVKANDEIELNQKLKNLRVEFDAVIISTHGSGTFGDKVQRPIDFNLLGDFELLKANGIFLHLGCSALNECNFPFSASFLDSITSKPAVEFWGTSEDIYISKHETLAGLRAPNILFELFSRPIGDIPRLLTKTTTPDSKENPMKGFQKINCSDALKVLKD